MTELEMLISENKLLRGTVEILSRDIAVHYERSRGAEFVEARAERISQSIATAIAAFEKFKSDIVSALHGRIQAEQKLLKLRNKRRRQATYKKKRK